MLGSPPMPHFGMDHVDEPTEVENYEVGVSMRLQYRLHWLKTR